MKSQSRLAQCESNPTNREKVIILGGGPNRIGQGIEFDYCCVHAAFAIKELGIEAIMINCNPETVSTDYDTSDRLYFEPLTKESVLAIIRKEQENGTLKGVIVQFGGQTPLKLAKALEKAGVPIIGTSPDAIDLAEDRERFQQLLHTLNLKQPANDICSSEEELLAKAEKMGFPLVVRPSYVLGGRAMEIVTDTTGLEKYIVTHGLSFVEGPILLDRYLQNAIEVDVDALCDGDEVFVAGIMEHIEEAGIHSGDSACSLPPYSLSSETIKEIKKQSVMLAKGLGVIGLMNVQFAVKDDVVYILEVNPRASRSVPFVAKSIGIPIAKIATKIMAGMKLAEFDLPADDKPQSHIAIKEAVFPFARFQGVDTILGPEMKSTGEAMGIDTDFGLAFAKAQLASGNTLPSGGTAFISVKDYDKPKAVEIAKMLVECGFDILSTRGTAKYFQENGIAATVVNKVLEGRPHIVDKLKDKEVDLVFNTSEGVRSIEDSFSIRRTALMNSIPYATTISGSYGFAKALLSMKENKGVDVKSLQEYFA